MFTKITHVTLLVKDQDEALSFYTQKLDFQVHTDHIFGEHRWLTLSLPNHKDMELVVAKAYNQEELAQVGKQGGISCLMALMTHDCAATYQLLKARGVECVGEPRKEEWGTGFECKDLYGNRLYIYQPSPQ